MKSCKHFFRFYPGKSKSTETLGEILIEFIVTNDLNLIITDIQTYKSNKLLNEFKVLAIKQYELV